MSQRILVIDDHPETLKVVSLILRRYGYKVDTVQAGLEGIAAAEADQPDLVLLDVMMPGIDGYEVCRRFRAHPRLANIPILMFTAKAQISEKWAGFQAGADDYVIKPTDPDELAARIKALLARSAATLQPAEPARGRTGRIAPEQKSAPPPAARSRPPRPELTGSCLVAVVGARGGSGATTVALNLAATMADDGFATTLIDLDMSQGHVAMYLNQKVRHSVSELAYLSGQELREALFHSLITYDKNWDLLLARPNLDQHLPSLSTDQVTTLLKSLRAPGHCIVADLGSGNNAWGTPLLQRFNHVVICLQPDRVGMWAAQLLLKQLHNRLQSTTHVHALMLDFADGAHLPTNAVAEFLRHPLMATIPLNKAAMAQAVNRGQLLVRTDPHCQARPIFDRIARQLIAASAAVADSP